MEDVTAGVSPLPLGAETEAEGAVVGVVLSTAVSVFVVVASLAVLIWGSGLAKPSPAA
jgi:hypothetical protein